MYKNGERAACFICDFWWLILLLILFALAALLTRNLWGPELFPETWPSGVETETAPEVLSIGDVQVALRWDGSNDIDLRVIEPSNEVIYYGHRLSETDGQLEVDANAACSSVMDHPVEHIYWPEGAAPNGEYEIVVVYFANCGDSLTTAFSVELTVDGESFTYQGELNTVDQSISVTSFER